MKRKSQIALFFFLLISFTMMKGVLDQNDFIQMLVKPLLMVTLAIFYLVSVKKPNFWYISALFFSFWGDSLLLFADQYFVFGLGSFLIAHILFITLSSNFLGKFSIPNILLHTIPFVAFLIFLISLIYENLNNLLIPVILYGAVISVFGVVTFLIYTANKSSENLWLFLGALIFIASDSVLAINKFYESKEIFGVIIMLTYITAQFLICKSIISKTR